MGKKGLFDTKDVENTPFLFTASIVITAVLIISALLESAVLFRIGLLGFIVVPFMQAMFGERINRWFEKHEKRNYTATEEETDEAHKVHRILED